MEVFLSHAALGEDAEAPTSNYQVLSQLIRGEELPVDDSDPSSADDDGILRDYRSEHNE